jgi:hypothetical protein
LAGRRLKPGRRQTGKGKPANGRMTVHNFMIAIKAAGGAFALRQPFCMFGGGDRLCGNAWLSFFSRNGVRATAIFLL